MEDGPPRRQPKLTDTSDRVSRAPPYSNSLIGRFRVRGCHPLWRTFPGASANDNDRLPCGSGRRMPTRLRAAPLSLIATWGISVDFFSSGYLDISVPRVCLVHLWIQRTITGRSRSTGWVSPFGHPRIKVCCRLSEAYRRLPRPSSPSATKASTECACSLDHITQPARRGHGFGVNSPAFTNGRTTNVADHASPSLARRCRRTILSIGY